MSNRRATDIDMPRCPNTNAAGVCMYRGPCLVCACARAQMPSIKKTCGCSAGILLNRETYVFERCDECKLFASDDDALGAVLSLLTLLGDVYEALPGSMTVADAMDALTHRCAVLRPRPSPKPKTRKGSRKP